MPSRPSWWERLRRWWRAYHWSVVGVAALLAAILGFLGFRSRFGAGSEPDWYFLYRSIQLFALEGGNVPGEIPVSLEVARYLAPTASAYALSAVIVGIFREELMGLRTRFRRNHWIVCGLQAGWAMIRMLGGEGERVVVIERDPGHPRIESCRSRRIPVLLGDARDEHLLRKAGIRRARRLFAVCGDDGINMKVAERARALSVERNEGRLEVLVHVADPYLCNLLVLQEMERTDTGGTRLDFFNLYEGAARALLSRFSLAGAGSTTPHLVVVGAGRLGSRLIIQAAREWLAQGRVGGEKLWVTVVDEGADARVMALKERHPFLESTCRLDRCNLPSDPARLARDPALRRPGCPPPSIFFVCMPDDAEGIGIGMALRNARSLEHVPIVVRIYDSDLAALLPISSAGSGGGFFVFDQLERAFRPDRLFAGTNEVLAQTIHRIYLRQMEGVEGMAHSPSMVPWEMLPPEKRESNVGQAADIAEKLRNIGCELSPMTDPYAEMFEFLPAEVEELAELEHQRWMRQADPADRNSVPWDELGEEVKEIDRNFIRRMPALLASAGFQIERLPRSDPIAVPSREGIRT